MDKFLKKFITWSKLLAQQLESFHRSTFGAKSKFSASVSIASF